MLWTKDSKLVRRFKKKYVPHDHRMVIPSRHTRTSNSTSKGDLASFLATH